MTVLITIFAIVAPDPWAKWGVLYVAFVSNYALDLTSNGAQQAAQAKVNSEESDSDTKT